MVSPRAAALVTSLIVLASSASAQTPPFDKARDAFREGIKKSALTDRIAGIRELVDVKDVRGADDFAGAIRVAENAIAKKREEIETAGKENREIWKTVDEQNSAGRPLPRGATERAVDRYELLRRRLDSLNKELNSLEATRAALHDGLGKLLTSVDASARSAKILEMVSAAQKATSFDDKLVFIRTFGAIRAPESRDALIELARLNPDGQVRTAAVTALGELEDPTTIPSLSEALKDEVWSVKAAAAQALTMIPSVDSVPALAEALGKNDGGTGDAIIKALEDITGVTFFDNATLWANWFKQEGTDVKSALSDLESGEPTIRTAAMNILAGKGTLAGVRAMLRQEGLDPARDARAKVKPSAIGVAESRPAAKDEIEIRRAAIAKTLQSRPKPVRNRAISTLILEPVARALDLDDDVLQERYVRASAAIPHPGVLAMLSRIAETVPEEAAEKRSEKTLEKEKTPERTPEEIKARERVRRAAIEALGWQDQDDAVDVLSRVLRADKTTLEAKELCIASLERLRREACVRSLLDAMSEKGPVAEAAARALKSLTREDFGSDRAAWAKWWNEKGKETSALPKRKTEEEKAKEEAEKPEDQKGGTTFYGITTRSKRLLYVMDISGSMNEGEIGGATGGGKLTKMQVAKREAKNSITALPEDALFDIVIFADGVQIWKPKLMTATKEVKAEAIKWIDDIKAIGATNIFDALEKAFELAGRGATDKRYNLAVDTILFMSDGAPNRGRIVDAGRDHRRGRAAQRIQEGLRPHDRRREGPQRRPHEAPREAEWRDLRRGQVTSCARP